MIFAEGCDLEPSSPVIRAGSAAEAGVLEALKPLLIMENFES